MVTMVIRVGLGYMAINYCYHDLLVTHITVSMEVFQKYALSIRNDQEAALFLPHK